MVSAIDLDTKVDNLSMPLVEDSPASTVDSASGPLGSKGNCKRALLFVFHLNLPRARALLADAEVDTDESTPTTSFAAREQLLTPLFDREYGYSGAGVEAHGGKCPQGTKKKNDADGDAPKMLTLREVYSAVCDRCGAGIEAEYSFSAFRDDWDDSMADLVSSSKANDKRKDVDDKTDALFTNANVEEFLRLNF